MPSAAIGGNSNCIRTYSWAMAWKMLTGHRGSVNFHIVVFSALDLNHSKSTGFNGRSSHVSSRVAASKKDILMIPSSAAVAHRGSRSDKPMVFESF